MSVPVRTSLTVRAEEPGLEAFAEALRARISRGAPTAGGAAPAALELVVTRDRLELREPASPRGRPLAVDWAGDPSLRRRRGARSPLARAVGWRGPPWRVVDACAGLGRDAMLLALLGCSVVAIERSPVVAALLRDARRRALLDPELGPVVGARLSLVEEDARTWLARQGAAGTAVADVVCIDPMFSPSGRSALGSKELRLLGAVVGDDADAAELLEAARSVAARRVVVKRHLRAPPLAASPPPDVQWRGSSVRYDVWLRR